MVYFYKDADNLFHVGDGIIPAGRYLLNIHSAIIISLESTDTKVLHLAPIEVYKLYRENNTAYTDVTQLLNEVGEFFLNSSSDTAAIEVRLDALEDTEIKVSYYEQITTLSGQIITPNGAQILLDQWANGVDALISKISGGKPDFKDSGNDVISFDASGNYVVSPALPSIPSALIYIFSIPFSEYRNLDQQRIVEYVELSSTTGGGSSMYIDLVKLNQSAGNLHFSDPISWAVSKALIKSIKVETVSPNWDLYILQNSNGYIANDASIPVKTLMIGGNETENISMDYSYEDEDNSESVHLYWVDNSGSNTADFYITGVELT